MTSHDRLKESLETRIGEAFVRWLNGHLGRSYQFDHRGDRQPDLLYRQGSTPLALEVTVVYFNHQFAEVTWRSMRGKAQGRRFATTRDPDGELIASLNERLAAKCLMQYPAGSVLVVYLGMPQTLGEFEALLPRLNLPAQTSLAAIYVGGSFSDPGAPGGVVDWWYRLRGSP